jgi:hypothetical protein
MAGVAVTFKVASQRSTIARGVAGMNTLYQTV